MRRGEIFKLTWRDVDLTSELISIRATTTKTMTARTVGMTPRVRLELQQLFERAGRRDVDTVFGISDTVKTSFASACRDSAPPQGDAVRLRAVSRT
jgi:integrase